jgi:alkane 1-monooxygenase
MEETATATWRDGKRYLWVFGLTMPLVPFLAVVLNSVTGWGVWLWLGPIFILGLVPLIDWTAGLDPSNPPDDVIKSLEQDRYYRWLTYLSSCRCSTPDSPSPSGTSRRRISAPLIAWGSR